MKAKLATFAAAVLIGTMAGFAGEEVKVGSPFDLKLGSEELAVRHPKLPSRSYSVFYDDPHLARCGAGVDELVSAGDGDVRPTLSYF